jgi:hypothetical protein
MARAEVDGWPIRSEDVRWQREVDVASLAPLKGRLLDPGDKAILEAYLKGSSSLRQIARLAGIQPSSAWRKIRRIVRRLNASASVTCLQGHPDLTAEELAIVKDHLIRGYSIRRIAQARNLSYYRVRRIILRARALSPPSAGWDNVAKRQRRNARPHGSEDRSSP